MDIIGRYIFRQTAGSLVMILITLTLIVWMTTALREVSLVTNQGQSFVIFLTITMLAMPNMIAIVAPVALLISTLYSLNRLSGDSELIVLSACGSRIWRVMKPCFVLALIVAAFVMFCNAYLTPQTMRTLRDYAIKVRTDLISQVLQPGKFSTPEQGLTVHITERAADGTLLGLMIHDERDPTQIMTYLAEEGHIVKQSDDRALLIMKNGHVQRQNGESPNVQIIIFDSYVFDLSQFGPKEGPTDYKPRERFIGELINPDPADSFYKSQPGKFRSELHDRLSNPLYPILFVLIVGVYLGYPRTTRDSRAQSVFGAFALATVLRIVGLAGVNLAAKKGIGLALVWGIPIAGIVIALAMIQFEIRPPSLPSVSLKTLLRRKSALQTG
ncbi:MAG: LPS export ABC transporter permease LptF [Rhodomicrobiaceae bacterium]